MTKSFPIFQQSRLPAYWISQYISLEPLETCPHFQNIREYLALQNMTQTNNFFLYLSKKIKQIIKDSHKTSSHMNRITEIIVSLSGQWSWKKVEQPAKRLPIHCKQIVICLINAISDICQDPFDIFRDHLAYNRMSVICNLLFDCALFHTRISLTHEELLETQTCYLQHLGYPNMSMNL